MSRMADLNAVAQEAGIDTSAPDALAQAVAADREGGTVAGYLARVDAVTEAATEGPWYWHDYMDTARTLAALNEPYHEANVLKTTDDWPPLDTDAEFIALSRDAVPRMAAALRAVLAECAKTHDIPGSIRAHMAAEIETAIADALDVTP